MTETGNRERQERIGEIERVSFLDRSCRRCIVGTGVQRLSIEIDLSSERRLELSELLPSPKPVFMDHNLSEAFLK